MGIDVEAEPVLHSLNRFAKPVFATASSTGSGRHRLCRRRSQGLEWSSTSKRARIADVAREAGVSKTAVSFAFNSPDRLAAETAERIREVAESLGYRPHPVARMLTQRQTLTIGVLTPQALSVIFSNPFFGAFSEGVAVVAEESGLRAHFISPLARLAGEGGRPRDRRRRRRGRPDRRPSRGRADPAGRPADRVRRLECADRSTRRSTSTTRAAPGAAAEHLIGLGHREFLVIGVEPPPTTA